MKDKRGILGQFIGKCCDSEVVNNNGMFLSKELFENLLESDEYKAGIENGYYIGFLGHPEDVNDMNFKNACVVMTDMQMESNGDIVGTFDLIDTPVGRIVKVFTDAGVKFGISIRGAGDVSNDGTVDPDTFVFRGFDLVTFPAYDDCVPEFQAIAASTDAKSRAKYRKVCAAIHKDLPNITSCEAVEVLQGQFNENSDEYNMLTDRYNELCKESEDTEEAELELQVLKERVKGLTKAYIEKVRECETYNTEVYALNKSIEKYERDAKRCEEIVNKQNLAASTTITNLRKRNRKLQSDVESAKRTIQRVVQAKREVENKSIQANRSYENLSSELKELRGKEKSIQASNLVFSRKIKESEDLLDSRKKEILSLKAKVRETVAANEKLKREVSNLEASKSNLLTAVKASESVLLEYQQNYADQCAYEVGIKLDSVPVNASTTMEEIKSYIYRKAGSGEYVEYPTSDEEAGYENEGCQENSIISI